MLVNKKVPRKSGKIIFLNELFKWQINFVELLEYINFYVNSAKDDNKMLEKIYKILRDLVEEI